MTNDTDNTKTRRRWYRFRLRTLLIVITLCAFPFAWIGSEFRQARKEKKVIAWIEKMGGFVHCRTTWWEEPTSDLFGAPVIAVRLRGEEGIDLSPIAELRNLVELNLDGTRMPDLTPLAGLKNLKYICPDRTQTSTEQIQMFIEAHPNCELLWEWSVLIVTQTIALVRAGTLGPCLE